MGLAQHQPYICWSSDPHEAYETKELTLVFENVHMSFDYTKELLRVICESLENVLQDEIHAFYSKRVIATDRIGGHIECQSSPTRL